MSISINEYTFHYFVRATHYAKPGFDLKLQTTVCGFPPTRKAQPLFWGESVEEAEQYAKKHHEGICEANRKVGLPEPAFKFHGLVRQGLVDDEAQSVDPSTPMF